MSAPTVFISYSHDSPEHSERVLALSERLRDDGITTLLDQYVNGTPSKGWPRWMLDRLDEADSVVVVCTETYYRRFRGHEEPGKGKGADWEGAFITQQIYDERSNTVKFVPVLFAAEDEAFIPEPIRGLTYYLLTSEENYNGLYDFLLGQAGVEPRAVGKLKIKERRRAEPLKFGDTTSASPGNTQIAPTRLHHGADHLFGREDELAKLDQLAKDSSKKVLTIVAFGGVGKTSLVIEWVARQAAKNWEGFERVFDWSFFSQGTREKGDTASAEGFVAAALRFFGDEAMAESAASPWDKGARLAQLVTELRTLLVLDGVEPLQHPPGPLAGELKDPALATLLKGLARSNPGLCIVTTRERVADLTPFRATTTPEWQLHHLSIPAGVEVLKSLSVRGTESEFKRLVEDVKGHALTLNLLGRYLAKAHGGDIRKRDQVKFEKADAATQGGYAFKTIGAYEKWLTEGAEDGARQLAVLRLLGLFDRPADAGCMTALRSVPAIMGLTEPLVDLNEEDWNLTVSSLAECGLISLQTDQSATGTRQSEIDCHPLIREYFAKQLRENKPESWRGAHRRIYEHLCTTTKEGSEPTLEELLPLYQAVAHGCQAGLQNEACEKIYFVRIRQQATDYATNKLGAFTSELGTVACFFEQPWSKVSHALTEDATAWVFAVAAYCLRALGGLTEAVEPMRAALKMRVKQENWFNAARTGANLSELELTVGQVAQAVTDAEQSVVYADRSGNAYERASKRATHGNALHQAGRWREAKVQFREADQIQAEMVPDYPIIASPANFNYCDFFLAGVERDVWRRILKFDGQMQHHEASELCRVAAERAVKTLSWDGIAFQATILSPSLDHLTLGRVALYAANLEVSDRRSLTPDLSHVDAAVEGLRRAGTQHHLPSALLTRAWLRFFEHEFNRSHEDLDEAWEIAERGPMRLHMADIHLHRARLFHGVKPYPWNTFADGREGRGPKDDLDAAEELINKCGYHRRDEELADAKLAILGKA